MRNAKNSFPIFLNLDTFRCCHCQTMRVIVSNMANSKATRRYIRVPTGSMRSWINQDQSPPKTILAKSWITFTLDDNLSNTQNQILLEYSILSATVILKYGADKDLGLFSKNMSFVYNTEILIRNNHEWPTILAFHNLQSSYTHTHTHTHWNHKISLWI